MNHASVPTPSLHFLNYLIEPCRLISEPQVITHIHLPRKLLIPCWRQVRLDDGCSSHFVADPRLNVEVRHFAMEFTVPDDIFGTENCYSGQTGGVQSEPDTNLSGRSGRTWEEVGSDGLNFGPAVVLWAQATLSSQPRLDHMPFMCLRSHLS